MRKGTLNFNNDELYPKTSADMVTYSDTTVANIIVQIQNKIQSLESDIAVISATIADHEERITKLEAEPVGIKQVKTGAGYGQFFTVGKQGQYLNGDAEEVDSGTTLGITQTVAGGGYGGWTVEE